MIEPTEVKFVSKYREQHEMLESCVQLFSFFIPAEYRLTVKEAEIFIIVCQLADTISNPYSREHMARYNELFGREMTTNAMMAYLRKIRDKKVWLSLPDTSAISARAELMPYWVGVGQPGSKFVIRQEVTLDAEAE